jgi:hypothetical protein
MCTEEKIVLAFIYKRSGKDLLTAAEIHLPLAIELKWFTNTDAKLFVEHCIKLNILKKTTDGLQPTFNIHTFDIPTRFTPKLTFHPNNNIQKNSTTINITQNIIDIITKHKKKSIPSLMNHLKEQATTKNISTLAAALLYAKEHSIPLSYKVTDLEQAILQENGE